MTRSVNPEGIVKVQPNGLYGVKTTIPKRVAKEIGVEAGDLLQCDVNAMGEIIFRKIGVEA